MRQGKHENGLQIYDDWEFQRRSWRVQRIGWVLMVLFILAGLMGLLGSGWLGHTTIATADRALQLEYDRFLRLHSPSRVKIRAIAPTPQELQIRIERQYLEGLQVARMMPEPDRVEIEPENYAYYFLTSSANRPVTIALEIEPERVGWLDGKISLATDRGLQLRQWVYP